MDKIAKIEIAKKGLIYIFVLIDLIIVIYLISGYFALSMSIILNINTLITMIFVMVILAVTVKYLADMVIVKFERE